MRLPLLIAAIALIAAPAHAFEMPAKTAPAKMPAGEYVSDQSHTSVVWSVDHMGLSKYTARFTKADAVLNYDPTDVTKSTLKVTIDPRSLETDFPNPEQEDFNKKLSEGEEWLNAGKFPQITFTSTKIVKTGKTTAKVIGDMEMMGVKKPLTLNVTFNGAYEKRPVVEDAAMGFSATTQVKRSDWGFGTYVGVLGDTVDVSIQIELTKSTPAVVNPA